MILKYMSLEDLINNNKVILKNMIKEELMTEKKYYKESPYKSHFESMSKVRINFLKNLLHVIKRPQKINRLTEKEINDFYSYINSKLN